MKTNTLIFLASLAVLAVNARAAQSQPEPVVLPAYVVETPRYLPAEQRINASLSELRQQAHAPVAVGAEYTALRAQVRQDARFVQAARDRKAVRVAKS